MGRVREPGDVDRLGLRGDLEATLERIQGQADPDEVLSEMADGMI